MTFLELCQRAAVESGTVSGTGVPSTTVGQDGRLGRIVSWTASEWTDIQRRKATWLWLTKMFSGSTIANQRAYAGSDFAEVTGGPITRFSRWVWDREALRDSGVSCYLTSTGATDERALAWLPWEAWYPVYERGTYRTQTGYPQKFTIDDDRNLRLFPTPDAAYTIRGRYYRSPQILALDADTPEAPERHHDLIWQGVLVRLAAFDENAAQIGLWAEKREQLFADLCRDQLPEMARAEGW